jgi:TRAP-type C4-dicarboxylate transport system substrate-binding protein
MLAARIAAVAAVVVLAGRAEAEVLLKLGTLAPSGSAWHEILKEMGRDWEKGSAGEVKLRIYAGGVQGAESEMIRKLGIGQLNAAALSNVGIHSITPEPKAMSIPLFFESEAEAECVFEAKRPALDAALLRRGFKVVQWSRLGALQLFCTAPRPTPAEMADVPFFVQPGDPAAAEAWRAAGFRTVELSATDIYPGLATGMVQCVPSLPLYVLTARLFERARFMNDLEWGYMYGATLIRIDAWERIAPATRTAMLDAAARRGVAADAEVRRMNRVSLEVMRKQGLTVVPVDPAPWYAAMRKGMSVIRGSVVPAPFYDELVAARDTCRAARAAAAR